MKNFLLGLILSLLVTASVSAQAVYKPYDEVYSTTAFANGDTKTTLPIYVGNAKEVEVLVVPTEDTASFRLSALQYGYNNVWATAPGLAGDTLTALTRTAKGWQIRTPLINRIPGAGSIKLSFTALGSGNGVTTPGFKVYVKRTWQ